jgi:hypothetical protein
MDTQHEWIEFGADGSEVVCTGERWSLAPRFGSHEAVWVRSDFDGALCRIVRAARAHHVGVQGEAGWLARGGRMVVKGEWYREVDPRSRLALDTERHVLAARRAWKAARSPARPGVEEAAWITVVNAQAKEAEQ